MGADETVFHKIPKEVTTEFTGYDKLTDECDIGYIATDDELIENAGVDDEVYLVAERTPFYAESGGQVGDKGFITTKTGKAEVLDVQKAVGGKFAHKVKIVEGGISVGQTAKLVPAWTLQYPLPTPGCVPPSGLCALSPRPPAACSTSGPRGGRPPSGPAWATPDPSAPSRSPPLHRWVRGFG